MKSIKNWFNLNRAKINFWIDIPMGISFIICAITSLAIFFYMPSGVTQGRYQEFIGISKTVWSQWHVVSGMIMIVLAFVHLLLHLNWYICMSKSMMVKKKK